MTVRNARNGKTMEISSDTWEKWVKLGLHRNWRVIKRDEIEVKKAAPNQLNITEFLGKKKEDAAPANVTNKRKYVRRIIEGTQPNPEQT